MTNRESFWKDRRVLVTGAGGFLGSWVSKKLVDLKAVVVGLIRDRDARSYFETSGTSGRVTIVQGDLVDYALIERVLGEYEIDTCLHLGAQALVTVANRAPYTTFESNTRGTWNVLEAARKTPNVKRIVVASSDKAYGAKTRMPYNETDPLEGDNPYDLSKTCADLIAQMYHKSYGLPVTIARCGNLYGPGDLNFDRIIPGTMRSLILGERPVIRSDGSYIRDYFYIEDAVEAYLTLAERCLEQKGEAFNFGTQTPTSVLDLVREITAISGKKIRPKVLGIAKGEIKKQYLSGRKAEKLLGWKHHTSLQDALGATYHWYKGFLSEEANAGLS
ncbi:MAG: sugar dehydratase [Elusimicrobia bacterium RIFCSPLOWO2_01_FULL_64_13]|nr:MAG: sugar dehydratase [Elusimicrobia bacterium RIFCSPLOWO2_01_FULL_64_13]